MEVEYLENCRRNYDTIRIVCDDNDLSLMMVNDLNERLFELEKRYASNLISELYDAKKKDDVLSIMENEEYIKRLKKAMKYEE